MKYNIKYEGIRQNEKQDLIYSPLFTYLYS